MISKNFRLVAVLLVVFGLPAGVAVAGQVTFPGTFPFVAGGTIRAADVNAAFTAVKSAVDDNSARIAALEAASAARQGYHSVQGSQDANGSVDDTWVDVQGTAIPVTFASATTIRYQAFAKLYNYGSAAGTTTSCSVRIVQDATSTPLVPPASPATFGDWSSTLNGGADVPGNDKQVALGGLALMPAGSYTFKLQVVRKAKAGNSGNCSIFRWSYSRANLFIDVVP